MCDHILRFYLPPSASIVGGKPADGYHESTRVSRAGHTASPASILRLDGRGKNASTSRPTLAWCAGLRMNARESESGAGIRYNADGCVAHRLWQWAQM